MDNVLAIGALAAGNIPLLAVGLGLSLVLVLFGSAIVAVLMHRLPWLLDVAALVLGWTAASMVLGDERLGPVVDTVPYAEVWVHVLGVGLVFGADVLLRRRYSCSWCGIIPTVLLNPDKAS